MIKLKVALLEDEEFLLKDLKRDLEDTGLVEITFYALSAKEFVQKMETHRKHPTNPILFNLKSRTTFAD